MFVENIKEGALAIKMRGIMERWKYILGYNIKIVERVGSPLKWMSQLSKRIFVFCNLGWRRKGQETDTTYTVYLIYTWRNRLGACMRGGSSTVGAGSYREGWEDSHIWKHQVLHNGDAENLKFSTKQP